MPIPIKPSVALIVFWAIFIVVPLCGYAVGALVWNRKLLFAFPLVALLVLGVAERLFRVWRRLLGLGIE